MFYLKLILSIVDTAMDWFHAKKLMSAGKRQAVASMSLKILEKVGKANEIRDNVTNTSDIVNRLRDKADDADR